MPYFANEAGCVGSGYEPGKSVDAAKVFRRIVPNLYRSGDYRICSQVDMKASAFKLRRHWTAPYGDLKFRRQALEGFLQLYLDEDGRRAALVDHVVGCPLRANVGHSGLLVHVVGLTRCVDYVEAAAGNRDDDIVELVDVLAGRSSFGENPCCGSTATIVCVLGSLRESHVTPFRLGGSR